jgi:hypothetical protein
MKKFLYTVRGAVAVLGAVAAPMVALAANVNSILATVQSILSALIPIVFTIALLYFLYGLAQYIMNAGDADKQKEARDHMIYGIIALFVMVAVWGLIGVLGTTFGITPGGTNLPLPTVAPVSNY